METVNVKELIEILEEYPSDMLVYYATRYALVPFDVHQISSYLVIEMSKESKDLFNDESWR